VSADKLDRCARCNDLTETGVAVVVGHKVIAFCRECAGQLLAAALRGETAPLAPWTQAEEAAQ
jgi:hypothetical protein